MQKRLLFLCLAVRGLAGCNHSQVLLNRKNLPSLPARLARVCQTLHLQTYAGKFCRPRTFTARLCLSIFGRRVPDVKEPLQFAKEIGVRYPLAIATDNVKPRFGGIEGLPTTMFYDRQGILRMKVIGFEYTDKIESALRPLL
jgi:hypothetical protein